MKAFKLINIQDGLCSFEEGSIPLNTAIDATHFFAQIQTDPYQLAAHPAPRYQFVITLKGKLKFTVSNGSSFILEPGIILVAKDLHGKGHTWEMTEGNEWHRLYIVPHTDAEDHFIADAT
jgi:hypothetical protein